MTQSEKKVTGYDKYVNWKLFIIPVVLFFIILMLPIPNGMKDVGTEVKVGPKAVIKYIVTELFNKSASDAEQWELLTAEIMERNMRMGALAKKNFMKRDVRWCKKYDIKVDDKNFNKSHEYIDKNVDGEQYASIMKNALDLKKEKLVYEGLSEKDRATADKGAWDIKVAVAMAVFVVFCFMTECIPLPGVSFCVGLILVFTGVVSRSEALLG